MGNVSTWQISTSSRRSNVSLDEEGSVLVGSRVGLLLLLLLLLEEEEEAKTAVDREGLMRENPGLDSIQFDLGAL